MLSVKSIWGRVRMKVGALRQIVNHRKLASLSNRNLSPTSPQSLNKPTTPPRKSDSCNYSQLTDSVSERFQSPFPEPQSPFPDPHKTAIMSATGVNVRLSCE